MVLDLFFAGLYGLVEGITEFLPISSTGHLILLSQWLNPPADSQFAVKTFADSFSIIIQVGAIAAVAWLFRKDLMPWGKSVTPVQSQGILGLWGKVLVAALPALALGFVLNDLIDTYLFNAWVVAGALGFWGVIILIIESRKTQGLLAKAQEFSWTMALGIGLFQCLAMVPGTSRSASTIIGALLLGATRPAAAQFAFVLGIPTLGAAAGYKTLKYISQHGFFSGSQLLILLVGILVSFVVAMLVVSQFMKFISKHDFKVFGWYRIALAAVIVAYFAVTGAQVIQ